MRSRILCFEELVHRFGAQEEAGRRSAAMRAGAKLKSEWRVLRPCIRANNICTDRRQVTRTRIYRREGLDQRALAAAIFPNNNRHSGLDVESAFSNELCDCRD